MPQIGEGDGTPLQYSCLENLMDRGAWYAAVHGVAKSLPCPVKSGPFPIIQREVSQKDKYINAYIWNLER